jgi:hypothetical protein
MESQIAIHEITRRDGYGKHLLFFPSRKNHTQVVCHSTLEADYCVHLEYDPKVIQYVSQPGELQLLINDRQRRYRPDFQVETSEQCYYTEVKVNFSELSSRWATTLRIAQETLREQGIQLVLADLATIRPAERLRSLKFLYFHSFNVNPDEFGGCMRLLPTLQYPVTLRHLLMHPSEVRERAIYRALFERLLDFDLSQRLTLETPIWGACDEH